jgi:hypothetical protein
VSQYVYTALAYKLDEINFDEPLKEERRLEEQNKEGEAIKKFYS